MLDFRTIYVQDMPPTGGPVAVFYDRGRMVLLIHEPSLEDDPRGVMDIVSDHRAVNGEGFAYMLRHAV